MGTFIPIAAIQVGERLRALDPAWVAFLAEDIAANGLDEPVSVVERGAGYVLIGGARRIAAMRQLGRAEIEVRIVPEAEMPREIDVRLGEIKSNMMRAKLTLLERARYIAAWREAYETLKPPPKRGRKARPLTLREISAKRINIFTEAAIQALGLSQMTVYRLLKIATISPEVARLIALHPVANMRNELMLLSDQDEARQAAIATLLNADPATAATVSDAIKIIDKVPPPIQPSKEETMYQQIVKWPEEERLRLFEAFHDEMAAYLEKQNKRPQLRAV